jgi:hypothetical protein
MARIMDADDPNGGDALARWMTVSEIAQSRKISRPSAARMVRRKGWRKQKANSGATLYFVPVGEEQPREANQTASPSGDDGMTALLASKDQTIGALQGHLADLRVRVDRLEQELDGWRNAGLLRRMRRAWTGR